MTVNEPVAWRILCTTSGSTGYLYTEQLPFEPGPGVHVRRDPEPLYEAPAAPPQCARDGAIYAAVSKRDTPPEERAELNAAIDAALSPAQPQCAREALERTETLLSQIAGKNDLSGIEDDVLFSAACKALVQCESLAREALEIVGAALSGNQPQTTREADNEAMMHLLDDIPGDTLMERVIKLKRRHLELQLHCGEALERIRDFPYVGALASAEIVQIAQQGLAALSGRPDAEPQWPDRHCQKCGCETKGEEAWVDGQIWCHPCADAADTSQERNTP